MSCFLFTDPGTGTYRQDAGRVSGDGQQPDGEFPYPVYRPDEGDQTGKKQGDGY